MKKGDVYFVDLPHGANTRLQQGPRPAIVFQNKPIFDTVFVIPFTSNQSAQRFTGTHLIKPTSENGLKFESIALVFQLRPIDVSRLRERKGKISESDLNSLEQLIKNLLL